MEIALKRFVTHVVAFGPYKPSRNFYQVALRWQSSNAGNVGLSQKVPKFQVFCVTSNGCRSAYEVSKTVLYHDLGLTVRDLRFQHTNMLAVRNKKIIIRFEKLKAIICTDAVLLIDPPFSSSKPHTTQYSDIAKFWDKLPILLTGSMLYTSNLPLEYRAIEAIFMHIISNFKQTLETTEPGINKLLKVLTDPTTLVVDRSLIHVLLQNSARLNTFATSVREFCDLLEEILEYDEDIRNLCISIDVGESGRTLYDAFIFNPYENTTVGKEDSEKMEQRKFVRMPRRIDHKYKINLQDEMETLLDSFLRDAEEISNKVGEIKEAIENSNTAILINLDSHRNMLLRLELQLTMGMFSCTVFGMLGMAFGMNLESSWEENPLAFWAVSAVMFGGAGVVWRSLLMTLRKNTIASSSSQSQSMDVDQHPRKPDSNTHTGTSVPFSQEREGMSTNRPANYNPLTPRAPPWNGSSNNSAVSADMQPYDINENVQPHEVLRSHSLSPNKPSSKGSFRMRPLSVTPDPTANLLCGKSKHRHLTTCVYDLG